MPAVGVAQVTQAWLRSTWQIQVPQTWLDACVEWVLEEAGGAVVPQNQLNHQVMEQWLLTDLRDLAHPILPAGVSEAEKMELNGSYCLQVDSLLDVSQPAYSQLQRVRGADCTNDQVTAVTQASQKPWEAKPTRMLMVQLTDGVQSLEGMEYQPVPALNATLPPGTKLQLVGKVMVRLGVLLLKAENVRVLGGEVEQLVLRHSQSRVLCRTLGLPEEDQTQAAEPDDQDLLAGLEGVEEPQLGGNSLDSGYDTNRGSLNSQMSVRTHQAYSQSEPSLQVTPDSSSRNVVDLTDEPFDDVPDNIDDVPDHFDDIPDNFDDIPDNFDDIPDNFDDIPEHIDDVPANSDNTPEDFDDIPMEELDDLMTPTDPVVLESNGAGEYGRAEQEAAPSSGSFKPESQASQPPAGGQSHRAHTSADGSRGRLRSSSDQVSYAGASADSFSSTPREKVARLEPAFGSNSIRTQLTTIKPSKAKTDVSVLNYLCNLQEGAWPPSSVQVVRLQAFIVTLLGNLRVSDGEWKLRATISDGTGYLDVDLCDAWLSNLIGVSAAESRTLKNDPAKRGVLNAGLQNCQRELVDMCCVMSVQLEPSGKNVVLRTDPLTDREYCELQRRSTDRT